MPLLLPVSVPHQCEQASWNETWAAGGLELTLPGQEGARQKDMFKGGVTLSLGVFEGLIPNYGDGGGG